MKKYSLFPASHQSLRQISKMSHNIIHPDLREECGVCGVFDHRDAAHLVYLGLTALQHRGQESAGIVSFNEEINPASDSFSGDKSKLLSGSRVNRHIGMGLVFDVFKKEHFNFLRGRCAVGHVRYSTAGSSILKNAQPILVTTPYGQLAIGHNGNLTNAISLRKKLESSGAIFQTTTDSEVILHLIARSKEKNLVNAIRSALTKVEGAYSLLISCDRNIKGKNGSVMIAVRDPIGFRPLVLGRFNSSWVIASETCAFDLIGAKTIREIDPGEMIIIENNSTFRSERLAQKSLSRSAFCIFEFIYFARPDSKIFGESVYAIRREMGRQLAREFPSPNADCVIAVPDSSLVAAIGYAEQSKLPFEIGFLRSHYVGRTFIEPSAPLRDFRTRVKFNPIKENIRGKKIVLVDDSIVRGITSKKLVQMLRSANVKEIHMRIASPPITGPCYYGIDTPRKSELIASAHSLEDIRKFLKVDSLRYLSMEGMLKSAGALNKSTKSSKFCTGCFSGNYPTRIEKIT